VGAWVRLYTRGLPEQVADERIAEVSSDLHDHATQAQMAGVGKARLSREIARRLVRGAPADLTWRAELRGLGVSLSSFGLLVGVMTNAASLLALSIAGIARGLRWQASQWEAAPGMIPVVIAATGLVCGMIMVTRTRSRVVGALWILGAAQIVVWQGIPFLATTTTVLEYVQRISAWPLCMAAIAVGETAFLACAALWWAPQQKTAA